MKYLFYFNTSLNEKMLGILVDEALEMSKNKENSILFAYCGGVNQMCLFNNLGNKKICSICKYAIHKILDKYEITNVSMNSYKNDPKDIPEFRNSKELREITYRGVKIGFGILSSYISQTRNLAPKIDNNSKKFFESHVKQNIRFVDALYSLIEEYAPDVIYGYNGRFEDARAIYDISLNLGKECRLTEDVVYNHKSHRLIFVNHLPHDIRYNKERRDFCWKKYPMCENDKIELGKSFFEKRRHGEDTGDLQIYIAHQEEGLLPEFDDNKINIAIMNSSEDEFAAVGAEWDELKMFDSQYEGIRFLVENASTEVHFYLRIHPHLKGISYKYHTSLYELEKLRNNITIIPPESPISTYSLMDKVDKIITFGSTMGIESCYWRKTSISLGPSMYYYDKICYHPQNKSELLKMLTEKLPPLYNDNIVKFGAYMLNRKPLSKEKGVIDWNIYPLRFLNYSYSYSPYFSIWFNAKFTAFVLGAIRVICDRSLFRKYTLPLAEE